MNFVFLEQTDKWIGNIGIRLLSEALKNNVSLTKLNLYGSEEYANDQIGDDETEVLSEALKTNVMLTSLNLGGCQ